MTVINYFTRKEKRLLFLKEKKKEKDDKTHLVKYSP